MDLSEIRNKIDSIDSKILKLLGDRMEFAIMSRKFKEETKDSTREKELLERIRKNARGLINPDFCSDLYEDILKESKRLQEIEYKLICFQGEHGAYSEVAAKKWNNKLVPIGCKDFSEVFSGVKSGTYEYGIVPVENTLGGVVEQVNKLLIHTDLSVVGAVELSIFHSLMILPGANYRDIKKVYSHPQALSQCREFIKRNKLEKKTYYDTAGAAKKLSNDQLTNSAAICSSLAAEIYNLEIIKEDIQDLDNNKTRFLVLSKKDENLNNNNDGNKCSISFNTSHKSGTLFSVLEIFAKNSHNLTRIESIPSQPGFYTFFLDFMGSINDDKVKQSLKSVEKITSELKILGCYIELKA